MTEPDMLDDGTAGRNPSKTASEGRAVQAGGFRACFVSSVVYEAPLDPTSAKKFRALESLGDVFVLGFAKGLVPARIRESARFFLLPRFPTPALRYLCLYTAGLVVLLKWTLRDGVTVLVAQGPYEGLVAAIAKRLSRLAGRNVALVVESHGDFELAPFLQTRVWFAGLYRRLIGFASRVSFEQADAVRAISTSTCEQVSRWAPEKPMAVFPTWTDIDSFLDAYQPAEPEKKDPLLLLFAGVLTRLKAVDVLIEAFARITPRVPGARLRIVGQAEDREYARSLVERVEELNLRSRVTFLAPMRQSDLAREMARAAVLVLPSLSEGLGRVVFEAMATGTPVVGSRVGGIVDLILDGETGFLVPPENVESLAERLEWVLTHPERVREMGRKARELAQRLYSTDRYVAQYRGVLSLAIERSEASTRVD